MVMWYVFHGNCVVCVCERRCVQVLEACITEALRLASGSMIMRFVRHDQCQLTLTNSGNTYTFRKGDRVGIFPTLLHLVRVRYP